MKTIIKHRVRPRLRQMAPAAIVPAAVIALAAPFWWLAAVPLSAWAGLCIVYGIMLGLKSGEHGLWATGLAAMIMHFGWSLGFWKGALAQLWRSR